MVNREEELVSRLSALGRVDKARFAASCAELLWPLVGRFSAAVALPDTAIGTLRGALDAVWLNAGGQSIVLADALSAVEALVPRDDDVWAFEAGYGESAVAAVAYAIRTWIKDDPQEAVWAARQVSEAADFAAQKDLSVGEFTPATERLIANSPLVIWAVGAVQSLLSAAESGEHVLTRSQAQGLSAFASTQFP